jgi:hypothetical protein
MVYRRSLLALALLLLVGPAACSSGSGDATAPPTPPPAPPPGPAPDVIRNVTVRFDSITVLGSCDHDSIFESANDGEFVFAVSVRLGTQTTMNTADHAVITNLSGTYREGLHRLPSSAFITFTRNVTKGDRFSVLFSASERDGALGNDSKLNNKSDAKVFQWVANGWSGTRDIQLNGPDAGLCGVRLRYTVTSAVAA